MSKPNFLIIMVDQLNGTLFNDGPADFLHVPNLRKLSDEAVNFGAAYCGSPLCAPSRAAFMSGQLPGRSRIYDNAAEFPSSIPTFAHYLRRQGYKTTLSGKMHFVGPDQLHGFEDRLTTDIYPADFGWTPDWSKPDERIDWWYHNLGAVKVAGVGEITNQLEYDDEVAYNAKLQLYNYARHSAEPFCLTVSFTHPHDPYVTRKKYWDMYPEEKMPDIQVKDLGYDGHDPHSKRLYDMSDWRNFDLTEQNAIDSRRAYYGNISYLDDKVGEILDVLKTTGLDDNTVIVFCADHGDMLGERGLWYKMSFYEGSNRTPFFFHCPERFKPAKNDDPVSILDLMPTMMEMAGDDPTGIYDQIDGRSLLEALEGGKSARPIYSEYAAEGSISPMVSLREGNYKLNYCPVDPLQFFNIADDPTEMNNLADDDAHAADRDRMLDMIMRKYDFERFDTEVHESQQRRLVVYDALRQGGYFPWDFQPLQKASERYMRNHLDLNVLDATSRFPPYKGE